MKTLDLIGTAIANTLRAKTRSILTILAIFIGAFTLTLTSGLGTGINAYISDTVTGIGAAGTMTVTKTSETQSRFDAAASGPVEYDPDAISTGQVGPDRVATVTALTPADLTSLAGIDGVTDVHATKSVTLDYIRVDEGTQYLAAITTMIPGQTLQLADGSAPDNTSAEAELTIPVTYVEPLGFASDAEALGSTLTFVLTDAERTQQTVTATIVGVAEEGLASPAGTSLMTNNALTDELFQAQAIGLPSDQADRYAQATIWFDADATDAQIDALKDRLADAGYTGTTVEDTLGAFTTVIDSIVLVLNAFAIIALLAASFGIVNTLYMSVQERTREIGLMKAMGMGSGRVFSLFSLEAIVLGFLGSTLGVVVAMATGSLVSSALANSVLSGLPGLTLIAFDPISIALIIGLVTAIGFVAGTLPAARAANADPVNSLRYE